jgi:hypothetical protein
MGVPGILWSGYSRQQLLALLGSHSADCLDVLEVLSLEAEAMGRDAQASALS